MINQPTGRKGGFLFVDGPIIRPHPRLRPLAKKDVTTNPQWKPEFSPLTSNVQKGNQLPTEQSHTLDQSYFESALRLRFKINTMCKIPASFI